MPKKILVIEDDPENRKLIEFILNEAGYVVVLAIDGGDGLEKAISESPDVIITDIAMPRLDGLRLIQLLRTTTAFRYLPILAITSFGAERATEALKAGADHALARPIRNEFLIQAVQSLIQNARPISGPIPAPPH